MKEMREDICYNDGMCVASGEYEGQARHCWKDKERRVSQDLQWPGFLGLQGIFLSQVCYYEHVSHNNFLLCLNMF
jgi:hypothetical protein